MAKIKSDPGNTCAFAADSATSSRSSGKISRMDAKTLKCGLSLALIGSAVGIFSGCSRSNPTYDRAVRQKEASMSHTCEAIARSEANRASSLRSTWQTVEKTVAADAEKTRGNGPELEAYIERDVKHWHESQPNYRRWLHQSLDGKPETIPDTAIILFY